MTDTTITRPLPLDLGTLRQHWLPPAPTGTAVTRTASAMAHIKTAIRSVTAMIADIERADRDTATLIANAAEQSDVEMIKVMSTTNPDGRALFEHRLAILRKAFGLAVRRHTAAEANDPDHTAWRRRCDQLTREWEQIMSSESDDERFARLTAFVEAHSPR